MTDTSYSSGGYAGEQTLTGFFDSRSEAEAAISQLRAAGFGDARVTGADSGATTGASEQKGFLDSLSDLFFPDEDRHAYEEGIRRGGYLVTVSGVTADRQDAALEALENAGSVDFDEREQSWRSEGWSGYSGSQTTSSTSATGAGERSLAEGETLPVVEENIRVGKRDTSLGRVRVRSYVRETPVTEEIDLRSERVEIERRPVDRPLSTEDRAFEERSIEAEERQEEAVVSKEARVVEEIGLRKETETRRETVHDTVRHQDVEIEREDATDRREDAAGGSASSRTN